MVVKYILLINSRNITSNNTIYFIANFHILTLHWTFRRYYRKFVSSYSTLRKTLFFCCCSLQYYNLQFDPESISIEVLADSSRSFLKDYWVHWCGEDKLTQKCVNNSCTWVDFLICRTKFSMEFWSKNKIRNRCL